MHDPLGLVGAQGGGAIERAREAAQGAGARESPSVEFRDVLMSNLKRVNELQQDATTAIEDLQAGRRTDVETVLMATQKADTAFRMLLQVRNKVLDAYEELKQIRV